MTNNHPVSGDGTGNPHTISLDINHSTISGSRYYNLWVNDVTPLTSLRVMVQDSDLSVSGGGVAVAFDMQPGTGGTTSSQIDLGGGALGGAGRNCIFGGAPYGARFPPNASDKRAPGSPQPGAVLLGMLARIG